MPQPKKPTAIKLLHGSRKHKINNHEPKTKGSPQCPDWLHPLAKEEWNRIVTEFSDLGLITAPDQSALAAYCQAYARWVQAEAEVEKLGGLLVHEPIKSRYTGEVTGVRIKKNPAVTVAQQERQAMLTAGRLFGLNPAARSTIAVPEAEQPKTAGRLTAADVFLPDDYKPEESIQ